MFEDGAGKHRQTVKPHPGAENAQRDDHPGKKLFVAFTKAVINGFGGGVDTQLAKAGGEPPPGHQITKHVTREHADYVETVAVSLPGGTGKSPGAKLDHEGCRTHHPPQHSPATAKIVAGGAGGHLLKCVTDRNH